MKVEALVQAAGDGLRLGLGPKAFLALGGITLLERAVRLFRDIADRIIVAAPPEHMAQARALMASERTTIIPGGSSRSDTTRRLIAAAEAPWLILHDVVHPFATRDLVTRVLGAAFEHGSAAPAIVNTEFLYHPDGTHAHAPGAVLNGQKPVAFSRERAMTAYRNFVAANAGDDPSLPDLLQRAGISTRFVDGDARNIKITGPGDLALARAMLALDS